MQTTTTNQLYNALSRLSRLIHRMEHRMAHDDAPQKLKIHRSQTRLLSIISQNNGASQRDLAELMDIRPSSMTEMLLRMEQAGLITRKQDANDQRVMRIFLTEAGEKATEQSNTSTLDLTAALFNSLTTEEQTQMLLLIEKLSANLEVMDSTEEHHGHQHGHHGYHGQHHHHHGHHGHHYEHNEDRRFK